MNMIAVDVWSVDPDDGSESYFATFESVADCAKWMWSREYEAGNRDIRNKLNAIMYDEGANGTVVNQDGNTFHVGYSFEHGIPMKDRWFDAYISSNVAADSERYREYTHARITEVVNNVRNHLAECGIFD